MRGVPGATKPSVHFDNAVLPRSRVEGILDVAFADNAQVPNDFEGRRPEHMVLVVR